MCFLKEMFARPLWYDWWSRFFVAMRFMAFNVIRDVVAPSWNSRCNSRRNESVPPAAGAQKFIIHAEEAYKYCATKYAKVFVEWRISKLWHLQISLRTCDDFHDTFAWYLRNSSKATLHSRPIEISTKKKIEELAGTFRLIRLHLLLVRMSFVSISGAQLSWKGYKRWQCQNLRVLLLRSTSRVLRKHFISCVLPPGERN